MNCSRCGAKKQTYTSPLCVKCKNNSAKSPDTTMPVYRSFAQVSRHFHMGRLIRIRNKDAPYYDGVYRIRYFDGACAGKRVFPGPFEHHPSGARPKRLRRWDGDVCPGYVIPGYDPDDPV